MEIHDSATDQDDVDGQSDELIKLHDRAMRLFDETVLPQQENRAQALMARRFISIPGAMWDGTWGEQFENSIKVEIDKVSKGHEKIGNDYRENRIVPDYRPSGGESDEHTANTLDGLHRADNAHFKSQQARDNAFDEASAGGFGAYRLTNEWADPYDKESDYQRINPGMVIVDADQRVFFDGNSKLYDKSDARFCFVLTAYTRNAFNEEFGEENATDWPFRLLLTSTWDQWFRPDVVMVAEFYEKVEKDERLYILTLPLTGDEERVWSSDITPEELADRQAQGWQSRYIRKTRCRVRKYTMNGAKVVRDHGFIVFDTIPVVPVYGKRYYVDNQEWFRGYVSKKMDGQRVYNAKVSKLAETDTRDPGSMPIVTPQQIAGHEKAWAEGNLSRSPYRLLNPLIDEATGQIISTGPIGEIKPPEVSPVTALLLQVAAGDLTDDDKDIDEVKANTSAEAMDIAATRIDAKSGLYLDNMRQSVQREGEIYKGGAAAVYFEPGREVETMDEEGADGVEILHEPFTDEQGLFQIRNDLAKGQYKVVCSVTEATATRRDKTVKSMLSTAQIAVEAQDMELAQAAILTAVLNQDGEGIDDFHKWARKKALALGLVTPTEEEAREMEEAAANQQPDATQQALMAQAAEFEASAGLKQAQTGKAVADTELSQAKTVETLASADLKQAQSGKAEEETKFVGMSAANDREGGDQRSQPRRLPSPRKESAA